MSVIADATVSLDGFIADDKDDVGPLFDWYSNGDVVLHGSDGPTTMRVSAASAAFVQPIWDSMGAMVIGRRLFDLTDGWSGSPVVGDHVFVVSHREEPAEWRARFPDAPFTMVNGVAEAVARAREVAGDRHVSLCPGDVFGQALALGLVDELCLDVAPVVFGSGRPYFGSYDGPRLRLEDPEIVAGNQVTHLRFRLRRNS
jgi:dihydrofolate reductase